MFFKRQTDLSVYGSPFTCQSLVGVVHSHVAGINTFALPVAARCLLLASRGAPSCCGDRVNQNRKHAESQAVREEKEVRLQQGP